MEQTTLDFTTHISPKAQLIYDRLMLGPITSGQIRDELGLLEYRRRITEIRRALPEDQEIIKTFLPNRVTKWEIVTSKEVSA